MQLTKVGDVWEKEVNLRSADEKVLYKFVVDGNWITDHEAPQEDDGHYNVNNVLYPKDITRNETVAAAPTTQAELERKISPPGAFPDTPRSEAEQFSVQPIPASDGFGNPVQLAAGEKVPDPSAVTSHTVASTVTTSKADYDKDASATAAFPAVAGLAGATAAGAAVAIGLKEEEKPESLVPESSLPMGDKADKALDAGPFISSVGPAATTASLAADVPLEKKRQGMVIDPADAPTAGEGGDEEEVAAGVPAVVKESLHAAHQSPEAAASPEAVEEKNVFEKELLQKVKSEEDTGESAASAANQSSYYGLAPTVPDTVEHSMQEAHAPQEAAAESSVVAEKAMVEQELHKKVPISEEVGQPAPTIASALSATAPSPTHTAGDVADGAVAGAAAVGSAAAVAEHEKLDTKPAEVAPVTESAPKVPGTSSAAAAAVADGATLLATSDETAPPREVPVEKSEADQAEYAPVQHHLDKPGVSDSAAAAVADGAEDSSLANEPAVQMMNQQDLATTHEEATPAPVGPSPVAAPHPAAETTTTTTTAKAAEPAQKAAGVGASDSAATKAVTPNKPVVGSQTSSPATSTSKEKKKRHRISGFFKKIFD